MRRASSYGLIEGRRLPLSAKFGQIYKKVTSLNLSYDGRFAIIATQSSFGSNGYIDELSILDIAHGDQFRTLEKMHQ